MFEIRKMLRLASALCAMAMLPLAPASAAGFPAAGKPIRIVIGLAAGGPTDLQARVVAEHLGSELGTNVIVENRPGASMTVATAEVARARPDGYTLLYSPSSPFAQNPHTFAKLPYDPFKDFTPISLGCVGPLVLVVHDSVPARNLQELVAYAKAHPGQLNYGSFGRGSSSHLYGQLLAKQFGLDMVHVPYKGAGDVGKDLVAGRVQLMFAAAGGAVQFAKSGHVHMIGITAPRRSPLLPGVPTLAEEGAKGLNVDGWVGFFGPAKMPPAVLKRLNAALAKVLADPEVKAAFDKTAYEVQSSSPGEFQKMVRESYERWGEIVAGLHVGKE